MSDENEITPLLPFTSHRSRRSSKCSEIDENEIVSYVQQRRQSIASVGHDKIPKSFALPVTTAATGVTSGGVGVVTGGGTSGVASPRLARSISRSSLISGNLILLMILLKFINKKLILNRKQRFSMKLKSLSNIHYL